ncbi:MAG: histidine phosphatase family protein [Oscillospiraceae bacterium]
MTRIYFVRHAEAEGNVKEFFQGRIDCDISEKGAVQLEYLAKRFETIDYDVIYSSPLGRAMATAKAVNRRLQLPIIKREDIIEINGGVWEGKFWTEIERDYPVEHDLWKNDMKRFTIKDGESMTEVYERMKTAIADIVRENQGKTIVVVSHGCALRNYLAFAEFGTADRLGDVGWSDNTAVSLIEYDDSFTPKIIFKNDSSHLPPEASTLAFSRWSKYDEKENGK